MKKKPFESLKPVGQLITVIGAALILLASISLGAIVLVVGAVMWAASGAEA